MSELSRTGFRLKIHWHVILTHFPISFFMVSAGFMIAHVFTDKKCFDTSGFVTLVAGMAAMLPTTLSGWLTWRRRYRGARVPLFLYKERIAYAMTALSVSLVVWRLTAPAREHTIWHAMFGVYAALLFLGAIAEGYYGERLNHH